MFSNLHSTRSLAVALLAVIAVGAGLAPAAQAQSDATLRVVSETFAFQDDTVLTVDVEIDGTVELAGLLQEREQLRTLASLARDEIASLRETVARLRGQEARITRRLENARAAYDALQSIEPALAFVAELTPGNTRVLSTAQEPVSPTGTSLALVALVTAVVAALAATLFVFLREAVREPAYERAPASREAPRGA